MNGSWKHGFSLTKPRAKTVGRLENHLQNYHLWVHNCTMWPTGYGTAKYIVELYKKNASQTASRARASAVSIKRTNEPLVSNLLCPTYGKNCTRLCLARPHRSQSPTSIITPVIQWLLISIYVYKGITMREPTCICMRVLLDIMEAFRRASIVPINFADDFKWF